MLIKKSWELAGCLLVVALIGACSSDKILPKGDRVSILTPVASIKPDVDNGATLIKVPVAENNLVWTHGDMNAQHLQKNINVSFKNKQWKQNFGQGNAKREFLISKPLIANGIVYALDADGVLQAFNLKDASLVWKTRLSVENKNDNDSAIKGVGIALDGNIIFATTGYGYVFAVEAKSGKIVWSKNLSLPIRISPVVASGKVFIQTVDNKFFALDAKNGNELWNYDISSENTTLVGGASATYCKNLDVIITGFSNGELQAFNANLGTPLWSDVLISNRQAYSSTFLNTIKAAPVIEGNVVYALGNANVLTAIDIRSGSRVWEKEIGGTNTPLVVGNTVYVVTNDNELVAIDKQKGTVLWAETIDLKGKSSDVIVHTPVMFNGRLVLALSNGIVYSIRPQTGKVINFADIGEELVTAPISAGGYVIFTTESADLIAYK